MASNCKVHTKTNEQTDESGIKFPVHYTVCNDEWVIKGKVYRFDSEWISNHPGGPMILNLNRGRDCSELFESYHFLSKQANYIESKLESYYVRDAIDSEIMSPFNWYDAKYIEMKSSLRARILQYTSDHSISSLKAPYSHIFMYFLLVVGMLISFYYLYLEGSVISMISVGCFAWILGTDAMHTATHYAIFKSYLWNEYFGHIAGGYHCVSWTWLNQHVINHHSYTNIDYLDTDLYWFHDLFFVEKIDNNTLRPKVFNSGLSVTSPQNVTMLKVKVVFGSILSSISPMLSCLPWPYPIWLRKILRLDFYDNNNNLAITPYIVQLRVISYIQYIICVIVCPVLFMMRHGIVSGFLICTLPRFLHGLLFSFFSQVSHVNELPDINEDKDSDNSTFSSNFIVHQINNSVDYECESRLMSFLSINLNNQAFHHLLPSVHGSWYPQFAPLFSQFCKDFNIKQNVCDTVMQAQTRRWEHLKRVNIDCLNYNCEELIKSQTDAKDAKFTDTTTTTLEKVNCTCETDAITEERKQ